MQLIELSRIEALETQPLNLKFPKGKKDLTLKKSKCKYPNLRETRKQNDKLLKQKREELTNSLLEKIRIAKPNMSAERKQAAILMINSLRPSFSQLKAHYRKRGDSEEVIKLLLKKENYEHLPLVRISKQQQQDLLKEINRERNV